MCLTTQPKGQFRGVVVTVIVAVVVVAVTGVCSWKWDSPRVRVVTGYRTT